MPKYSSDIDFIIDEDSFLKMFNTATRYDEKSWITILWITGARPAEVLEMQKKHVIFHPEFSRNGIDLVKVEFVLSTKKLGNKGKFTVRTRKLIFTLKTTNKYLIILKKHLNRLKDDHNIFNFSRRTGYNIIDRLGQDALGVNLCPYNFRHSRLTLMAEKGATEGELMRIKGARSRASVKPYIHARKVEYDVEVDI
jgi:integrase